MAWIEEIITVPYYLTPGWTVTVRRNTASVTSALFDNTEQTPANQDIYDAVRAYLATVGWHHMGFPRLTAHDLVECLRVLPRVRSVEVVNHFFANGAVYHN